MTKQKLKMRPAIDGAKSSKLRSHRVGAALYHKNKLINVGWNKKKTHPKCPTVYSQHAEFNVCIDLHKKSVNLSKCSIYIARLTRTGKIGIAKPCEFCQAFLDSVGIKRIFYTDDDGGIKQL